MIDKGAKVRETENLQNRNGLHLLCEKYKGDDILEVIELFIDEGKIDVKETCQYGENALHFLCKNYRGPKLKETIQLLIDKQIGIINAKNARGRNALHILCIYYDGDENLLLEIVRLFIDKGIDLTATDNEKSNVIHLLCKHYRGEKLLQIASEILSSQQEIDIGATCGNIQRTALHVVCEVGNKYILTIELIELFISKMRCKDDVNKRDRKGNNALHLLCCRRLPINQDTDLVVLLNIATLLIDKGIDVSLQNEDGDNALHLLCKHCKREDLIKIIQLLVSKKIEVRERNRSDKNALDLLCEHMHENQPIGLPSNQQPLLNIVKYLVDEVELSKNKNEIKFYDNLLRSPTLYLLLANYNGVDLLETVKYFVFEKGIAFVKENAFLRLRQNLHYSSVSSKEEIEKVLQEAEKHLL